ncbi:MAG TPA: hypothetical protein DCW72_04365 [Elusimicrobia bacterium]|nr:MAG: hypothetical protein A2X29_04960 [Elusimicrobia bacterium GWA2_64_40]OGR61984.1 MAG: hypothetical protein A2X30_00950 [Elusimicrobia bacterium GWB2_63_16]HAN04247.1 hypothetical protein [Elusimicrobiota bacterium]HAU89478.1 hypothetical protein [Elusimicrobiota bacterium]
MGIWDNAFKIPEPPEPTPAERQLLRELAVKIRARGLAAIAAFTVESTAPVHGLGAQGLQMLEPIVGAFFNKAKLQEYKALLENRKAVAYLVELLNEESPAKEDPDVKKRP